MCEGQYIGVPLLPPLIICLQEWKFIIIILTARYWS